MRLALVASTLLLAAGCAQMKNLADKAGIDEKDIKAAEKVAAREAKEAADEAPKNLVQQAAYQKLVQLSAAISHAGLDRTLENDGPYTVFAPTDEAFNKLPEASRAMLMSDAGKEKLKKLLGHHIVKGELSAADLAKSPSQKTLLDTELHIEADKDAGKLKVGDAHVTTANIRATNGVIHLIDTVLVPPG